MDTVDVGLKRAHDGQETADGEPDPKAIKMPDQESWYSEINHGKGRKIPKQVFNQFTQDDVELMENVKSSCTDLDLIQKAIQFRIKKRLCSRLPEDLGDSSYYIENGLRKVYPYYYLYQTHAKGRWVGRKLIEILKQEFRDIPNDQLKLRFDMKRILVNGSLVDSDYILKPNDFITNRTHRHELPVLATPIKRIHEDKDILVIDKPPSVPIHPCGRYRNNSVINILHKEYKFDCVKVVHRLDRLVSGVLIIARNSAKAHQMEIMMKNRDVQKEYVCRVVGDFPEGKPEDGGFITVDQPLDLIPGKIGITVVSSKGKSSLTKFKKLNFNGKTSAVLCQPKTGRMHQIRVHLQFLGHPIVNDGLYNCDSFGPERGKGGRYNKTHLQLSKDVIAVHRQNAWIMSEANDVLEIPSHHEESTVNSPDREENQSRKIMSEDERKEAMAALEHYFTDESWKEIQQKWQFDSSKMLTDSHCRDCHSTWIDPPLRRLFLYLHAIRYSGTGWSYESDMPVWAREDWNY